MLRCTFSFEEVMYVRLAIFGSLHRLKVFCHSFPHQRPLRGDPNFFKINSKIKGKCSLNAGFFKRKIGKSGQRTMLEGRAFEQRIAI